MIHKPWLLLTAVVLIGVSVYSILSVFATQYHLPPFYGQREPTYVYDYSNNLSFADIPNLVSTSGYNIIATVSTSKPIDNPSYYGLQFDHTDYKYSWRVVVGSIVTAICVFAGWICFVFSL